jgi:nucleoid DNA-binding protein
MNKADFITLLSKELKSNKIETSKVLEAVFAKIKEALKKNATLRFTGFGTFKVKSRRAREIRNPRDGMMIKVPKKNYVSFVAGTELKQAAKQNKLK